MPSFPTSRGNAEILYEDGDVILFSKPEGVLSERAEGSAERCSPSTGWIALPAA